MGVNKPMLHPEDEVLECYWNSSIEDLFESLKSRPEGLTSVEAKGLLQQFGPNSIGSSPGTGPIPCG